MKISIFYIKNLKIIILFTISIPRYNLFLKISYLITVSINFRLPATLLRGAVFHRSCGIGL